MMGWDNNPHSGLQHYGRGPKTGSWDLGHGRQTAVLDEIRTPSEAEVAAAAAYLSRVDAVDLAEMLGVAVR